MGHPRRREQSCWESFSWQLVRSLPDRTGHPRYCGHAIARGDWYATLPAHYRDSVLRRDRRRLDALGYPTRRSHRAEHPGTRVHHAKSPASVWIWLLEGGEDGAEVHVFASYAAAAATYDAWLVRNWEDYMAEASPATPEARAERFAAMRWLHELTSTIAERRVQTAGSPDDARPRVAGVPAAPPEE
jgi:hypothetical protein